MIYQFISHPKAGRTWLRLMLSIYFQDRYDLDVPKEQWLEVQSFHRLSSAVPELCFTHDRNAHLKPVDATSDKSIYCNDTVIYLVRDPRDVVVSNYFQQNRREIVQKDQPVFLGSISEYIHHPCWGIEHNIALMNIWADNRHVPHDFLLIKYEDLVADTAERLKSILFYLGDEVPELASVDRAVSTCSFNSMHKMELNDTLQSERLRPTDLDDPESFKVRRGKIGGYVDYLTEDDVDFVSQAMETLDPYYGYSL
jgi:hypothetical protein